MAGKLDCDNFTLLELELHCTEFAWPLAIFSSVIFCLLLGESTVLNGDCSRFSVPRGVKPAFAEWNEISGE